MYDLKAYAARKDGVISVTIGGNLPDSCYEAKIADKYPGGSIVYIRDPGSAQVFIEEKITPGSQMCLTRLVPWLRHVAIPDNEHDTVTVFINGQPLLKVEVQNEPTEYRVIALSAAEGYAGCSIIPADAFILGIYSSVFGPATKAECVQWVKDNCVQLPGSHSTAGGNGGEFPW